MGLQLFTDLNHEVDSDAYGNVYLEFNCDFVKRDKDNEMIISKTATLKRLELIWGQEMIDSTVECIQAFMAIVEKIR